MRGGDRGPPRSLVRGMLISTTSVGTAKEIFAPRPTSDRGNLLGRRWRAVPGSETVYWRQPAAPIHFLRGMSPEKDRRRLRNPAKRAGKQRGCVLDATRASLAANEGAGGRQTEPGCSPLPIDTAACCNSDPQSINSETEERQSAPTG